MGSIKSYRELQVWQRAFVLCKRIYKITQKFPSDERFGLSAQMRRAAVSVPSNIAEGYHRNSTKDYIRFLRLASGSLAELETQALLASELEMTASDELNELINEITEIERMLIALIRSIRASRTSH